MAGHAGRVQCHSFERNLSLYGGLGRELNRKRGSEGVLGGVSDCVVIVARFFERGGVGERGGCERVSEGRLAGNCCGGSVCVCVCVREREFLLVRDGEERVEERRSVYV